MTKNISEDTILIISADHGHKDIQKAYTLLDYPEIQECLIMPASLECRFLSFFVKEEMKEKALELLNDKQKLALFGHEARLNAEDYSYDSVKEKWLSMINDILS